MRLEPSEAMGERQGGFQKRGVSRRTPQGERPAHVGVQHLQDPSVRYGGGQVLAEQMKEGSIRPRHIEQIRHVLLLLLGQEKVLRFVRHPHIRHLGIYGTGKDGLPDIGEDQSLQEQPHAAGNSRAGTVDEHDLPLIL